MLNPFPELLTFVLFSALLLRVAAGFTFLYLGYLKLTREKREKAVFFEMLHMKPGVFFVSLFGAFEVAGGAMLVAGFYTQIAAIVLSLIALGAFLITLRGTASLGNSAHFYLLLFAITFSLLFSGAGAFAVDLPL